mmetsp:Transcript_11240/g.39025  ORF Transcript_11240/g.39025 Transcript_11240/m.39025 type:complete len:458 (+) Transcript_11240:1709-3082(+)
MEPPPHRAARANAAAPPPLLRRAKERPRARGAHPRRRRRRRRQGEPDARGPPRRRRGARDARRSGQRGAAARFRALGQVGEAHQLCGGGGGGGRVGLCGPALVCGRDAARRAARGDGASRAVRGPVVARRRGRRGIGARGVVRRGRGRSQDHQLVEHALVRASVRLHAGERGRGGARRPGAPQMPRASPTVRVNTVAERGRVCGGRGLHAELGPVRPNPRRRRRQAHRPSPVRCARRAGPRRPRAVQPHAGESGLHRAAADRRFCAGWRARHGRVAAAVRRAGVGAEDCDAGPGHHRRLAGRRRRRQAVSHVPRRPGRLRRRRRGDDALRAEAPAARAHVGAHARGGRVAPRRDPAEQPAREIHVDPIRRRRRLCDEQPDATAAARRGPGRGADDAGVGARGAAARAARAVHGRGRRSRSELCAVARRPPGARPPGPGAREADEPFRGRVLAPVAGL